MKDKYDEVNLRIKNLELFQDIELIAELYSNIQKIRRLFQFTSEVVVEQVYSLKDMEELVGGPVPDWLIGMGMGKRIWVLAKSKWKNKKMDLCQLILHEFVHLALNYKVRKSVPLWLNEGLAVYLSGQYADYDLQNFQVNPELDFYHLSYESESVYFISAKIVVLFVEEYGLEAIMEEIDRSHDLERSELFKNQNIKRMLKDNNSKKD